MSLRDIRKLPEYRDLSVADFLTALSEVVVVERKTHQQTMAAVMDVLTDAEYDAFSTALKAVAAQSQTLDDYRTQLFGLGLNWADERFQMKIAELCALTNIPDSVRDKLLAIGVVKQARWQSYSLLALPAEQDVIDADSSIAATEVTEWVRVRCNEVLTAIDAGSVLTIEAAKAALGAE